MRNLSKLNNMFICFRPTVMDIDEKKKPENKSLIFPKGSSKFSLGLKIMQQPPKKTMIRVYETILNRRASQKNRYFGSKQSYGASSETKSLLESSSSSSSRLSSCPSSPKSTPSSSLESKNLQTKQEQKRTQVKKQKQTKFESHGIYLILMSLLFTVIWGKLIGIILTSMCLYCIILYLGNSPSYYHHCSQKRFQRCSYPRSTTTKAKDHRGNYGKCYY